MPTSVLYIEVRLSFIRGTLSSSHATPLTCVGVVDRHEGVGGGWLVVAELWDGDVGEDGEPIRLFHLHLHLLEELVVQSVRDVKLEKGTKK